jgi:hypothetical protein
MQEKTNGNWIDVLVSVLPIVISIVVLFVCIVFIFMLDRRLDIVEKRLDKAEKQTKIILQPKKFDSFTIKPEKNNNWRNDVDEKQTIHPVEQQEKKIIPPPELQEKNQSIKPSHDSAIDPNEKDNRSADNSKSSLEQKIQQNQNYDNSERK